MKICGNLLILRILFTYYLHNVENNNCIYIALHSVQSIDIEEGYLMQVISFCILCFCNYIAN